MNPPITLRRSAAFFLLLVSLGLLLSDLRTPVATAQGQVQVIAADPPAAEQGTLNLNVKVTGKGFKNGAKAKWYVTGTIDTGGVTVNSTTFVSSTELTANITIADTAVISTFDIAVSNSDGRGGKGTELFAVTSGRDVTSTIFDTSSDGLSLLQLRSDGLNPDLTATGASYGTYQTSSPTSVLSRFETYNSSDWSVHLENSTSRWVSLTLTRLSGSGPTGTYVLPARVISRCFDPTGATTNTVSWLTITSSDSNCSLRVNFVVGGTQYTLVMGPNLAGTGKAVVSCNVVSGISCADWTVVPNLTEDAVINPTPAVANLYSIAAHAGKQTFIGTYYLTYRARVTYP